MNARTKMNKIKKIETRKEGIQKCSKLEQDIKAEGGAIPNVPYIRVLANKLYTLAQTYLNKKIGAEGSFRQYLNYADKILEMKY